MVDIGGHFAYRSWQGLRENTRRCSDNVARKRCLRRTLFSSLSFAIRLPNEALDILDICFSFTVGTIITGGSGTRKKKLYWRGFIMAAVPSSSERPSLDEL